jgi:hypothetical protein
MNKLKSDLKPMNVGDVLDYSVEVFRQNFKGIVLLSLILYVPWAVLNSIILNSVGDNQLAGVLNMYRDMFNGVYSPEMFDSYLGETSIFVTTVTALMGMIQSSPSVYSLKLSNSVPIPKLLFFLIPRIS